MKTTILSLSLFFISLITFAQTTISGSVTDAKNNPVEGANIYLEGTHQNTSDLTFKLTNPSGTQVILASGLCPMAQDFDFGLNAISSLVLIQFRWQKVLKHFNLFVCIDKGSLYQLTGCAI